VNAENSDRKFEAKCWTLATLAFSAPKSKTLWSAKAILLGYNSLRSADIHGHFIFQHDADVFSSSCWLVCESKLN
jgi:hypothetical protein